MNGRTEWLCLRFLVVFPQCELEDGILNKVLLDDRVPVRQLHLGLRQQLRQAQLEELMEQACS